MGELLNYVSNFELWVNFGIIKLLRVLLNTKKGLKLAKTAQ